MSDHIPDTGKMVPDTWMEAADRVLVPGKPMTTSDLRKALAAVAPMIAAAERERCAKVADEVATLRSVPSNKWVASEIATAIRSLGDEA